MRCKKCNYRLWNLTSRQCPECGRSFRPSEFEFAPNTVQFCCPHCQQPYYGTGERGHLTPVEFDCATCHQHVHMDEMVLLPAAGVDEERTQIDRAPWLDRQRIGVMKGWFSTIGMAMVNPGRLMRSLPDTAETGEAWWFAVVTNTIILTVGFAPFLLLIAATAGGGLGVCAGIGVGMFIGLLVASVGTVFLVALWGAITHGLLRATGNTKGPLELTNQALCFSVGANVLTAIPCIGMYVGWIWWVISATAAVCAAQEVRGWRAALAVLTAPFILLSILGILYVGAIVTSLSIAPSTTAPISFAKSTSYTTTTTSPSGRPMTTTVTTSVELNPPAVSNRSFVGNETGQARHLQQAIQRYAHDHGGRGPAHASMLLAADQEMDPSLFIVNYTDTSEQDVLIAGATLDRFRDFSLSYRTQMAARAAQSLPDSTIAHRVGDFVFCDHGMDLTNADDELWVVMLAPDPTASTPARSAESEFVGVCTNGTTIAAPMGALSVLLPMQNDIRRQAGLAPLPDPTTITHAAPAVAPTP